MALSRVQATAKVTTGVAPTLAIPFTTPPTVGNGLVVLVTNWSGASAPTGATDTYSNAYTLGPTVQQGGIPRVAFFFCPKVTATGAGFTITVTNNSNPYWTANAIEVSGVGGGLAIDQSALQGGTSAAAATGATAALTADNVLLAAIVCLQAGQSFITVEAVSPTWTEEFEELPGARSPGEGDSRVRTGVVGTTQSCSWTHGSTVWAAGVVAFKSTGGAAAVERVQPYIWMPS